MDAQQEQTPKLPIKHHLVRIRAADEDGPLRLEGEGIHHFTRLHDKYMHEVDGEDCFECPPDLLAAWCNRYKDDLPKLTALLDIAANRGLHHNMASIKAGEIDPVKIFTVAEHVEKHPDTGKVILREPAQSFVKTAEGKTILPLPIHDVVVILGEHHTYANYGKHMLIPSKGGDASRAAIQVIEEFLVELGLKPNHAVIRREYCANCGGHSNAEV